MHQEAVLSRLSGMLRGRVRTGEPMRDHTSFRIGGPADIFIEPADISDLRLCLDFLREASYPVMVIGNGTNLLVADEGIRGAVIMLGGALKEIVVEDSQISAQAGVSLPHLSKVACEHGLSGLEFACGIPGSLGGAVFMNAGAHGRAMQDVVASCDVLTPQGEFITYERDFIGFRPRGSRFEDGGGVIVGAVLLLKPGNTGAIRSEMERITASRSLKQPLEYPSAGCIFKNPAGGGAGRYIDWAGLKGVRVGDAQVSEKHANFIVNLGHASYSDVLQLMDIVRDTVKDRFGVALEPEVRMVGPEIRLF